MFIFGLLLCAVSLFIFYRKLSFVFRGQVMNGEVVGFKFGARGLYGMRGFNYRIRIEHEGESYVATSMESVVTWGDYPSEPKRGYFKVYFKPTSPKHVSIKGKVGIIWLAILLLFVGIGISLLPFLS